MNTGDVENIICCQIRAEFLFSQSGRCFVKNRSHATVINIKHLVTGPEGNSEFCFPRISMFPETKSRETLRFKVHCSGNKRQLYTITVAYLCVIMTNRTIVVKIYLSIIFRGIRRSESTSHLQNKHKYIFYARSASF